MNQTVKTTLEVFILVWQQFFNSHSWQDLIRNKEMRSTHCGDVYELGTILNRENEDCAIVDMRTILFAQPHYHPAGNVEIYFVLEGQGLIVVGTKEINVKKGDVVIIPPLQAHFTIAQKDLILGVINSPPFKPENFISLTESNAAVNFDYEHFQELVQLHQ